MHGNVYGCVKMRGDLGGRAGSGGRWGTPHINTVTPYAAHPELPDPFELGREGDGLVLTGTLAPGSGLATVNRPGGFVMEP